MELKAANDIGVFISILLMLIISLFYIPNGTFALYIILFFLAILFGLILFLWWRSHIKNSYLEKLRKRDIENMEKTINGLQAEIDNIKAHNYELAKIIHKDNKLIPAMELAVKEFISSSADSCTDKHTAEGLITQLNAIFNERKQIVENYESLNKILAQTGVASTDAIIRYLKMRAYEKNIQFDFSVNSNIKYMISNIISENDLNTLLADLGENALISSSENQTPAVLITIGIEHENYCISFYDNGPYFDAKVLKNLGRKQYTTHADNGGNGIGMLTAFELFRKYRTTFEINEFIPSDKFTKQVSVYFDSLAGLKIHNCHNNLHNISDNIFYA